VAAPHLAVQPPGLDGPELERQLVQQEAGGLDGGLLVQLVIDPQYPDPQCPDPQCPDPGAVIDGGELAVLRAGRPLA